VKEWVNRTFRRRIAVYFIPVIVFLILIIGGINTSVYYSAFLRESQQNIQGIIAQENYTMDLYFQDIKTTSALLADNDDLVDMLLHYQDMSLQERFYQQEKIDTSMRNSSLMKEHILDCMIVGLNGYQTNMPDRSDIKNGRKILDEEWMKPFVESQKSGFYYTKAHVADYYYGRGNEHENVISVIFAIRHNGKIIGYIVTDLDFQKLNDIVSTGTTVDGLGFFVADESGAIRFSGNSEDINDKLSDEMMKKLTEKKSFVSEFHGIKMFCSHSKSDTTGWEFIGMVPRKNVIEPMLRMMKILILLVMPVFLLLAVFISVIISDKVKRPLNDIVEQMEKMDIDRPTIFTVNNSVGEINYLAEKITQMSQRITNLVNQVYKLEIKSKDAQIEALISQINPHFLYNTLQLIKTESAQGKTREVSSTVNSLSRFLRYTINNRKMYVSLQDEIHYIEAYMEIYQKRFPGKYCLNLEIEKEAQEIQIPKLTLQPIVENAIKHGLRTKEGTGIITIRTQMDKDLMIIIEDNGLGMAQEQAAELLSKISMEQTEGHVGLMNIQERLKLIGGNDYGIIKIESEIGKYFRIYLRVKRDCDYV